MCDRLICPGKIQVDIRNFITIKPEENGERDIVAILEQWRAADRTNLIRQVISTAVRTVGDELAILAVRATPVRRQRIDLCDARHRRDKRRTDGTTGTDEISIVIRFLHETLSDEV